jgi:hypothetical protein
MIRCVMTPLVGVEVNLNPIQTDPIIVVAWRSIRYARLPLHLSG